MAYLIKAPPKVDSTFHESAQVGLRASVRDEDERGWRPLTGARTIRELPHHLRMRMLRATKYLYDSNPLARRIVEYTKNFVVGEGIYYRANDPRVKEVLDDFWYDEVNNWPIRQHERVLELCLYGEVFWPVSVNKRNGHVRLGYFDPFEVVDVRVNESNCLIAEEVILSREIAGKQAYRIIHRDENPRSPSYGYLVGEVFFFAVNRVSNTPRGTSDLLPLIDWIDAYDQFLFMRLDREMLINSVCWDVTLEGADATQIEEYAKTAKPPTPGTVRFHNERVRWEVVAPKLESSDALQESRLLRGHILAGAGFPPHWFADPEGVRAVAYEMGFPTEKMLVARQKFVKSMLEFVFNFVIDQAILARRLPRDVDRRFEVIFPEISVRDLERTSRALSNVVRALSEAKQQGWLADEECRKVISSVLAQIGVNFHE